jgi:lysophospholipase L1-like esterase
MRQKLYLVYFNASLLCVLLVGLELAGQVAYYLWKGYPVYESDQHLLAGADENLFEHHPFLAGRLVANRLVAHAGRVVTTTSSHTRWTGAGEAHPGGVTIAVVGGSTTFGAGVTDADSWPARLQALLGPAYSVLNYGVPGYSTAEAVIQMALLVPESRPDLVVFYEGWNDLHNFHDSALGPDYYSHGLRQYSNLDIRRPQPAGLFGKLVEVSAVCRLASVSARYLAQPVRTARRDSVSLAGIPRSEPDSLVERLYRRNLGTMRTLAEVAGANVLFVPQVLNESRFTGAGSSWWTPRIRNSTMSVLLRRMNAILSESCGDDHSRCAVLDVLSARSWQEADFIDEGHFSPQGNDEFARLVAAWVTQASSHRQTSANGASDRTVGRGQHDTPPGGDRAVAAQDLPTVPARPSAPASSPY